LSCAAAGVILLLCVVIQKGVPQALPAETGWPAALPLSGELLQCDIFNIHPHGRKLGNGNPDKIVKHCIFMISIGFFNLLELGIPVNGTGNQFFFSHTLPPLRVDYLCYLFYYNGKKESCKVFGIIS
jgi:hypothetical protein